jgi:hypothetical protein
MSIDRKGMTPAPPPARLDRLLRAAAFPLAAALAIGGQLLLAHKTLGPWRGIAPGVALYVLAAAVLLLALVRRSGGEEEPGPDGAAADGVGPDGAGADGGGPQGAPAGGVFARWTRSTPAVEWTVVALLLLLAFHLRVHRIEIVPRGLNNDEAINALEIQDILRGKPFRSLTERGLNRETMFHYLGAFATRNPGLLLNLLRAMPAVFDLQPRTLNDPSGIMELVVPLRSVAIAAGVLTVLALYLFARRWFGAPVAILAAFFLAVSPWHLLYSRVGLRAILAPLFAVVVAHLFLRALKSDRPADHVAWGIAAGLGFWSYTSFRAIAVAMVLFVLLRRFIEPAGRAARRLLTRPFLLGAACAAAILAILMALSPIGPLGFLARGAYATLVTPRASPVLNVLHALTMTQYVPARYAVIQSDAFISDGVSAVYGLLGREPETPVAGALPGAASPPAAAIRPAPSWCWRSRRSSSPSAGRAPA